MKIFYVSDIHTGHWYNEGLDILEHLKKKYLSIKPKHRPDVVVIAGDITTKGLVNTEYALNGFKKFIECPIVAVAGNHDFYGSDVRYQVSNVLPEVQERLMKNDIFLLEFGESCIINEVKFIGGTGWIDGSWYNIHSEELKSSFSNVYSDFRCIDNFHHTIQIGIQTREKIFRELKISEEKAVVVTHFIPSRECIHLKWAGNRLNPCFSNDWDRYINEVKDKISLWIFGHGHDTISKEVDGVKFVSNPNGYPSEDNYVGWKEIDI